MVKVATRSDLACRWHDLMGVNAGCIAEGELSIEEVGWEIFHLMLDGAGGLMASGYSGVRKGG